MSAAERDPLLPSGPENSTVQYGSQRPVPDDSGSGHSDEGSQAEQSGGGGGDSVNSQMSFSLRVLKTCAMFSVFLCLGLNQGIVGPTMLDLADLIADGHVDALSRGLMVKAPGILVGSILGGLIADRLQKKADLCLFVSALCGGLCCAAVPWLPNVSLLAVDMFIQGVAQGLHNVAACSLAIAIWGEKASTPIHFLHMGYTLGQVISQPVSGQFVSSRNNETSHHNGSDFAWSQDPQNYLYFANLASGWDWDFHPHNTSTMIYIPYGVFGAIEVLFSLSFLVFSLCGLAYTSTVATKKTSFREMINPAALARGNFAFGVYMMASLFALYVGIVFRGNSLGLFLCPIGQTKFGMSGPLASLLGLAFNISQFVGRLGATVLAIKCPVQVLVFVELVAICVFMIALMIWGLEEALYLWILSCAAGLFIGPNYPSIMAWADRYIEASGLVIMMIDVGIGVGAFLATFVGGILFEKDPHLLFVMSVGGAAFMLAVLIPLQIVSSWHGDRHKAMRKDREVTGGNEETVQSNSYDVPNQDEPLIN